ncbi:MAG: ribonuclease Y [Pseudomonadota bacterium]|nr:ribonuclease Y [Pseudomonadota bacterium]
MASQIIITAFMCIGIGVAAGFFFKKYLTAREFEDARNLSERILDEAKKDAQAHKKEILLQAQDEAFALKKEAEQDAKDRERELKKNEARLQAKEERLEKKVESLALKESELVNLEKKVAKQERLVEEKEEKLKELVADQEARLEEISGLTAEEARTKLMQDIESKARHEAAKMVRVIEMEAQESAHRKAQMIIASAVQRYAGEYVSEHTVSAVELPSEDMKGRIIGREGRNIRAIEAATGVDLIIDDTPETVILSAYNPLRREVAKRSLERLISDGRIHPARIEDIVKKVEKEMDVQIREIGEQATFDLGVHGIHPEIIRLLGQLRFRTSFTQNVLQHSLEVAFLCGIMAAELGLDVKKAKRAGLLHDLGKAVDHEVEGPHATIGADLAKKYNESPEIVHAVAAHHEDIPPKSVYAVLVQAADSLSGARPGARKELLESYVKRLEELEGVATGFPGVSRAFAIQAGREVRVMVDCDTVNDDQIFMLSKDIAKQIEEKMTYPGQIRVTVIREKRAVGIAK